MFRVLQIRVLIILLAMFTYSCRAQEDIRSHLRECVKTMTDKDFEDIYGVSGLNVYTMVDSIESNLQSIGILDSISKEAYLKLIELVNRKDTILTESKAIKNYEMVAGLIIVDVVSTCPYQVVVERENNLRSSIVNQFKMSQELLASGYEFDQIKEYVNGIHTSDFKYIEYRAPVMVMLLFHLGDRPPNAPK